MERATNDYKITYDIHGYRVMVEFEELKLPGGLKLPPPKVDPRKPPEQQKPPGHWVVVAIGEPKILDSGEKIPIRIKLGDTILFNPAFAIQLSPEFQYENRDLMIVQVDGIVAIQHGRADLEAMTRPKIEKATPQQMRQLVR